MLEGTVLRIAPRALGRRTGYIAEVEAGRVDLPERYWELMTERAQGLE